MTSMRFQLVLAAFGALLLAALPVAACPFCTQQGQTLTGEVANASLVLLGKLVNPKMGDNDEDGSVELEIEQVIKKHDVVADKKKVTLNKYVEPRGDKKYRYLVFCDVYNKGRIDPYRGLAVAPDSDLITYLKGSMDLKDAKQAKKLRFYFDYLDSADEEVSTDAFKEFANADYADIKEMAGGLPAAKIAGWLKDAKTPGFRLGSYASLLGHCGKAEDAELLRKLLDDPDRKVAGGIDGILAAYTMLKPKEGADYIRGLLSDPKKEFMVRYNALRAMRFFHEYRNDVVSKKDAEAAIAVLLDQNDIADLAIEDLRKWGCWDMADRVLKLAETDVYKVNIVKRAILRYALSCKKSTAAIEYVKAQRAKNPEGVADAEELLKLEETPVKQE